MKDQDKTQKQLIKELTKLRRRITELETLERQRKQVEGVLQTSEQHYRTLFEESLDGICLADAETGIIIDCNQALVALVCRERAELIGKPQSILHPPQGDKAAFSLTFKQHLTDKEGQILETQVVTRTGDIREVEIKANLLDLQGRKLLQGLFRDITERKRAEAQILVANERLQYLLSSTSAAIYTSKTSGDYGATSVTENVKQMTGYEPREFIENSSFWHDHVHPEDRQRILNELPRIFKKGSHAYEYRFLHKDGHYMWIRDDMRLIKDESKNPIEIIGYWIDITERIQAEEALRESEEKYRNLVERANDGIGIAQDAILQYVNHRLAHMIGYSPEELTGSPFPDFFMPEEVSKVVDRYTRRMAGEVVMPIYETALRHKDGSRIDVELNAGPIIYKGKPADLVLVRDITDRRRAEEALKESETQFRTLFEAIPDTVLVHDDEGIILHINEIGAQKLEWSTKDLVDRNLREIVTPENAVSITNHVRETHKAGWSRFETTYVSRSGWQIMAEVHERPIKFGAKKAILSVARNITERKRAEKELQESEERFRLAFENANTGVCLVDLEGNLTRVNAKMCEIFGYTKEELERMTVNDIAHPEDIDKSPMFIQETLEGKIDRGTFEKRYFHKKGHVVTCQVSSSLVRDAEGLPLYFISHVHDITRRKQAEKDLQHSYEQTKNTLVATVKALASTVEMKDQYTAGHQPRVTHLACAIAEEMGLSEEQIKGIHMAGLIHDIGKLVVPAEILNKPGPLTEVEYEMMKMHPQDGYDILKEIEFPWPVAQIILQHQEVMDGSGYPQGLSGEQIMIEARILRVANVIESLTAHRPYRPAFSLKEAIEEISTNRGILYDPAVVDACLKLLTEKGFAFD